MKKILTLAAAVLISAASFAQLADGKYLIDFKNSSITWHGEKVTGSGHDGNVRVSSGYVQVSKANVTEGKVKVDMNAITNTDLKDAEMNSNLLNHLRSEDFFNTAKFPDANFEVTGVKAQKDDKGHTHIVTGKLTVKGITQEISFPATIVTKDGQLSLNGEFAFDRSKFDVRYGSETFFGELGDKAINNDIKITFNLIAKKA
jgi:polyisoprenoid-binding protein YceI